MTPLGARWTRWRAGGVERLAPTLGLFLGGFFLLPSGKALNNVFYALVLTPAVLLLRGTDWRWLAASRIGWLAAALLLYLSASGLWSAPFVLADWLHEAKALPYLAIYLAVVAAVCARRPRAWERLLRAVVVAAVVGTWVSVVLFYRQLPWGVRLEYYGAAYNSNEAATLVGVCLLLALFHFLPASLRPWERVGWVLAALSLAGGMVLAGSRMPGAALLVCIGLGLTWRRHWRLLLLFGVALCAAIGSWLASGRDYGGAIERGLSYRPAIWLQYADRIAARPWLGEGILTDDSVRVPSRLPDDSQVTMNHPHNVYLATALYGGVPALALLGGLLALALQQGWRLAPQAGTAWLLVLIFGMLCMLTDGDRVLHAPKGIWFYFWLPLAVLIAREAGSGLIVRTWPYQADRAELPDPGAR